MRFSIIVACLNAGDDLRYTVENLLNQDYDDYEIVIKDGFSTDGSIEAIDKSNSRLKVVQKKR